MRFLRGRSFCPPEARWPAELALVVAVVLYVVLPNHLIIGPRWLIPTLEGVLVLPLAIRRRMGGSLAEPLWRGMAVAVIALINLANVASVVLLVHRVLHGPTASGTHLLYAAVSIWVTNVIVFALWYWELDRGGPNARGTAWERGPDLVFPQMITPEFAPANWRPGFPDYLYTAFTDGSAFSPTDAMPVTLTAKCLMMLEGMISLVTMTVIVARAIGIIG